MATDTAHIREIAGPNPAPATLRPSTPLAGFCLSVDACRSCGSGALDQVMDFGELYISDFVHKNEVGVKAPLEIMRCAACGLVQTHHTINPDLLFRVYHYRSGTNPAMRAALDDVVASALQFVKLEPGDAVLDIGANDGTLLACYPERVEKWAVEPAAGINAGALRSALMGVTDNILPYYWPLENEAFLDPSAKQMRPGKRQFKVITSVAAGLYHTDDPNGFVAAIKRNLHPDGVWVLQLQDEGSVLRDTALDYFCHEHVALWGRRSLMALLHRHGLAVQASDENRVNGGSIRLVISHGGAWSNGEWLPGGPALSDWQNFATKATERRSQAYHRLNEPLEVVLGVAASTKANTLLQWYGLGPEWIQAIVDVDPDKIGRFTVGSRIPIISEAEAAAMHPDLYVALAWHFLDGLRRRAPDVPFLTLLPGVKEYPPFNSHNYSHWASMPDGSML